VAIVVPGSQGSQGSHGQLPPVVGPEWLSANLDDVVVADTRWYSDGRSAAAAYESGHIAGAIFVNLDRDLSAPPSREAGRHPLPEPAAFAETMGRLGVSDSDVVIAYDAAGCVYAARLVWMLRATGHSAAVLDGGLAGWAGPVNSESPHREPARFSPVDWPADRLASIDEAASGSRLLIDARSGERYRGEGDDPLDPRSGHVPGAISVPCRENLQPSGRFLPVEVLRRRFESLGVPDAGAVTAYCGSGVTACHDLLALEWAGLGQGRLFVGSWSQWSSDPRRPIATGADPD
jgi:thiosulfate/3-mercaptopyruvate sulfurtransferase